jgi:hypothetical protein
MKSSETVENKGFSAICSPNPFIMLHRFYNACAAHKGKGKGKKKP